MAGEDFKTTLERLADTISRLPDAIGGILGNALARPRKGLAAAGELAGPEALPVAPTASPDPSGVGQMFRGVYPLFRRFLERSDRAASTEESSGIGANATKDLPRGPRSAGEGIKSGFNAERDLLDYLKRGATAPGRRRFETVTAHQPKGPGAGFEDGLPAGQATSFKRFMGGLGAMMATQILGAGSAGRRRFKKAKAGASRAWDGIKHQASRARGAWWVAGANARYHAGNAMGRVRNAGNKVRGAWWTAGANARYQAGRARKGLQRAGRVAMFAGKTARRGFKAGSRILNSRGSLLRRAGRFRSAAIGMAAKGGLAGLSGLAGMGAAAIAGPIAGAVIGAVKVLQAGAEHAEGQNSENRRFASYNPAIAGGFAQLAMSDMRRNIELGRANQDSAVKLTHGVDNMRESFQEWNKLSGAVGNRAGIVGAGAAEIAMTFANPILKGINELINGNDKGGENTQGFMDGLLRISHGIVEALGDPLHAQTAFQRGIDMPLHPTPPGIDDPWGLSLREMAASAPFRPARPVLPFQPWVGRNP